MANTSVRTLRLLSLLQGHRYWRGADLAARLEISERTLRRDVDRLRELGYPVESQRGAEGGYQLAAGAALPPLIVDDDEAVALVVGLQAAAQSAVAGVAEASARALAKVVQVLPPRLRRRAETLGAMTVPATWGGDARVDTGVLTTLAQAARGTERVELRYTDRAGASTEREVEPHRLVVLGRRWYLVAFDLARFDWRSFRLDRIAEARATGSRFPDRALPAPDAATFVRDGIGAMTPSQEIEALVDAPADRVRARIGQWATVEPVGDATCRVRMSADAPGWPIMALGSLAAEFTVVAPADFVAELDGWTARLGRAVAASRRAARTVR
jgi:predicted DNA-binding transcriptional regulator YafY